MNSGEKIPALSGLVSVPKVRRPPVHLWNPPFCGDIDMRIATDGTWYYLGTPILRKPMVQLFSSILRRDANRYVLVTPVEMVGITVEDAPFLAIMMQAEGSGASQSLHFITNVGDEVMAGSGHEIRFELQANGGLKPYVHVRDQLWAKLTRGLYTDMVALGRTRLVDGVEMFGVWSGGMFFSMMSQAELEAEESGSDC